MGQEDHYCSVALTRRREAAAVVVRDSFEGYSVPVDY